MVLPIVLDLPIGAYLHLQDTFEWDLTDPDNSPEEFAASLVADYLHSKPRATAKATLSEIQLLEKAVALEIRR